MFRHSFNLNWLYTDSDNIQTRFHGGASAALTVNLPYDAMIAKKRILDGHTTNSGGFFPGGTYVYTKEFQVPDLYARKNILVEFEGAYANTMVFVNDCFAGKCPHGYSNFYISLDKFLNYEDTNTIKVVSRSSTDSRWYSGGGIYRNVNWIEGNLLHILPEGLKLTTLDKEEDQAVIEAAVTIENKELRTQSFVVSTEIYDGADRLVASDTLPLTTYSGDCTTVRQKLYISSPLLWSPDSPSLYYCRTRITSGEEVIDEATDHFGIRKLQLDVRHGLRINGFPVKLRGACIHHDNGVIGANTYACAEERRIRILKEAGFNAIRISHNPASKSMLDACDRLGMLVMDEAFDMWNSEKTNYDYSLSFDDYCEKDLERMVSKDYNHPSVIMYSIGNEIVETENAAGAAISRRLAEKIRSLDSTRYILNSINGILSARNVMAKFAKDMGGDINDVMNLIRESRCSLITDPTIAKCVEESYAAVDIAGYNYLHDRYTIDHELYPNRIMIGSENTPADLAVAWPKVDENSYLLGNFIWTGWDYIGEAGIGRVSYDMNGTRSNRGTYPWYLAYCGDVDITGYRRPASYYHEIIWGLRKNPYIAVQDPAHYGQPYIRTMWTWNDYVSSWSWHEWEGQPSLVDVYSDAQEVELLLNGKSQGRIQTGKANLYKGQFTVTYQPGILEAVSYEDGKETGRYRLTSARDDLQMRASSDKHILQSGYEDLAFIELSLTDDQGTLQTAMGGKKVSISIEGCGSLLGFGSADPKSEENFFDTECTAFNGRLLAVIRSGDTPGMITARFTMKGCPDVTVQITVV